MQRDAQAACDVIVASPRSAQAIWRPGHECVAGAAGEDAQGFKSGGHVRTFQTVIAMFSLGEHFYQALGLEAVEVDAGGGGSYVSEHRKLGAGACAAVHEGVEHACAGGFADGSGNFGDGSIGVVFGIHSDIHTLMVDEVFL